MKFFYKKALIFIVLMVSILIAVISYLENKVQDNAFYSLPSNTKYLFVGSSFVSCGICDSEIDGSINMALAGESFFYSYIKIKKMIEANPQLKTIFLDYSNFKLTKIPEGFMFNNSTLSSQYSRYNSIADKSDALTVFTHNPITFLSIQSSSSRDDIAFFKQNNKFYPSYKYWGGHEVFYVSKVDSLIAANYQNKRTKEEIFGVGTENLGYLLKIKEVCSENSVDLILFRLPTHAVDPFRANEEFFQQYRKENLANITFLDFHDFPIKNEEFRDLDHLNSLGATKFSHFLNELLQDSLWIVNDKQNYIDRKFREKMLFL